MDNGISVIIAHFSPDQDNDRFKELLKETITAVNNQAIDFNTEIIICDDGSHWSRNIWSNNADANEIIKIEKKDFEKYPELKDLNIDVYLGLGDVGLYRGIILKNYAIRNAKYEKIVILDDDHPFLHKNSLKKYFDYLDKYDFVRGRVLGSTGIPQLYFSGNAQGTNYGLKKNLYLDFGGFSEYLYDNGYGEDNDILMKAFLMHKKENKKSYYAGEIVTKDLASNRWGKRSAVEPEKEKEQVVNPFLNKRHNDFVREFEKKFGEHPFENNPSRKKSGWVEMKGDSVLHEIKYNFIYLFKIPGIIFAKFKKLNNKEFRRFYADKLKRKFS